VCRVWTDKASGTLDNRPKLDQVLDTLVVWRLDRLGRNLRHLIATVTELRATSMTPSHDWLCRATCPRTSPSSSTTQAPRRRGDEKLADGSGEVRRIPVVVSDELGQTVQSGEVITCAGRVADRLSGGDRLVRSAGVRCGDAPAWVGAVRSGGPLLIAFDCAVAGVWSLDRTVTWVCGRAPLAGDAGRRARARGMPASRPWRDTRPVSADPGRRHGRGGGQIGTGLCCKAFTTGHLPLAGPVPCRHTATR
jgi:hypothetical protein